METFSFKYFLTYCFSEIFSYYWLKVKPFFKIANLAFIFIFLGLVGSFSGILKPGHAQAENVKKQHVSTTPKDVIVVKLSHGIDGVDETSISELPFDFIPEANRPEALKEVHSDYGISSIETIFPNPKEDSLKHVYKLKLKKDADFLEAALDKIKKHADVIYAQKDYSHKLTTFTPNDTYWPSYGSWGQNYYDLWTLKAYRLNLQPVWDPAGLNTRGEGIIVAVIDTGLDTTHPDIQGNYVSGWNFIANNSDVTDNVGHGTGVAGVIAAVGNNQKGIIGVSYKAKIMPLKAIGTNNLSVSSRLATAIQYATDHGAAIISNSWICDDFACPSDPVLEDAVKYANLRNVITVFGAGNDILPVEYFSPQNIKSSHKNITVSASIQNDNYASGFSNYGAGIDVAAPGSGILTLKSAICPVICYVYPIVGGNYIALDGTSMSAPFVSGLLALVKAKYPAFTAFQVVSAVKNGTVDIEDPGIDTKSGTGRINAYNSVSMSSPMIAKIDKPYAWDFGQISNNILTIQGTANGATFDNYKLQYATRANYLSGFTNFYSSTTPSQNGNLGTLNLSTFPTDDYFIQLKVHSTTGSNYFSMGEISWERPTVKTIPTGVGFRTRPQISGNYVVWEDSRQFPSTSLQYINSCILYDSALSDQCDIYLYDLSNSSTVGIYTGAYKQSHPSISGTKIVWEDGRNGLHPNIWGCTYDPVLRTCGSFRQYSNDTVDNINPTISGNLVAWERVMSGTKSRTSRIRVYDIVSSTSFDLPLPQGVVSQITPRLSGSRLIWAEKNTNGSYSLFSCVVNIPAQQCPRQLIDDMLDDVDGQDYISQEVPPVIEGNKLAWVGKIYSNGSFYRIIKYCTYDVSGNSCPLNSISQSQGEAIPSNLTVYGNIIIWDQEDNDRDPSVYVDTGNENGNGHDGNLYAFNTATLALQKITSYRLDDYDPAISGTYLVWSRAQLASPLYGSDLKYYRLSDLGLQP